MKLVFVFLFANTLPALAGNELGNGGDLVAQEFITAGRKMVKELREKPDPRIPDVNRLADAVETVKVTSTGSLTLHGAEVDAINYPDDNEIDVSRTRWQAADPGKRASLVLHEYLGILQVNDKHYEISGSYAAPFAGPEEKEKKFEIGVGTSFGWNEPFDGYRDHSAQPGISLTVGYALNLNSALLLQGEHQTFGDAFSSTSTTDLTVGYRYWLGRGKIWQPFLQMNMGYVWMKSQFSSESQELGGATIQYQWNEGGNFLMFFGGGIRYSVSRELKLDLSSYLQNYGAPWNGWNYGGYKKALTFNAGISTAF